MLIIISCLGIHLWLAVSLPHRLSDRIPANAWYEPRRWWSALFRNDRGHVGCRWVCDIHPGVLCEKAGSEQRDTDPRMAVAPGDCRGCQLHRGAILVRLVWLPIRHPLDCANFIGASHWLWTVVHLFAIFELSC